MMSRVWALALCLALTTASAEAYLKLGLTINGRSVLLRWTTTPVRYFVSDSGAGGVSAGTLDTTLSRAFATWEGVDTSAIRFSRVGFTSAAPVGGDGVSVIGFVDHPEFDRVLGVTSYTLDGVSGELLEADIALNASIDWSTASGGQVGRYDLESVALHEIGHLGGLGHSALGETSLMPGGGRRVLASGAVMFPIAFTPGNIDGRSLRADDVAGISDLYPDNNFRSRTGSVSGRVTKNGRGVFGAHVVAFHLQSEALIGNFTLGDDGSFVIAGIPPGPSILRVEPLDDGDLESFFATPSRVDLDFLVSYGSQVMVVPEGGNAASEAIAVRPK